jgi:hypothetical protein
LREQLARELGPTVDVTAEGAGVNWIVSARAGVRHCRIHCFHYGGDEGALQLGMRGNAHLSKVEAGAPPRVRSGAEYAFTFLEDDTERATARTPLRDEAASAARDWLVAGCDLAAMYERYPFVDETLRVLRAAIERVEREMVALGLNLRFERDEDWAGSEFSEAWIYAGPRSCRLAPEDGDRVSLALLLMRTQLGRVDGLDAATAAKAIAAWFGAPESVRAVQSVTPQCALLPFAADFERGDYSAWHWGNVLDQARSSNVLALHGPLLARIVVSETARRYYSFTSLWSLCFSRSSLYPFDTAGLPVVWPAREEGRVSYVVQIDGHEVKKGDDREVFEVIESVLAAQAQPTYFGNLYDRCCDELNRALAARGSDVTVRSEQHRQWLRLAARAADGRWCEIRANRIDDFAMVRFNRDGGHEEPRIEGSIDTILDGLTQWIAAGGGPRTR